MLDIYSNVGKSTMHDEKQKWSIIYWPSLTTGFWLFFDQLSKVQNFKAKNVGPKHISQLTKSIPDAEYHIGFILFDQKVGNRVSTLLSTFYYSQPKFYLYKVYIAINKYIVTHQIHYHIKMM